MIRDSKFFRVLMLLAIFLALASRPGTGQVVSVTLKFDTNRIAVGQSTTLHVLAQIVPERRASTDRIFSWYVDLLSSNANPAALRFDQLQRSSSDQDPATSSAGTTTGSDRIGIYDTYINLPAAGKDIPVELFSMPVQGLSPGRMSFRVRAGTGVPNLNSDFIVAAMGGGDPLFGGVYTAANADLEITSGAAAEVRLNISATSLGSGRTRLTLTYNPIQGQSHVVEFKNALVPGAVWQSLPGAPHNAGTVVETNTVTQRFYRVRIGP